MNDAFYITADKLAECGKTGIPPELVSTEHLIYSSPATLAFNSPGAQGFGVKRAGLAVPGSVMLLVAPRCCGRNTSALGNESRFSDRFFYLLLDDTDIVTGRHLSLIPDAVCEVCATLSTAPSAVMICITCVDALLGTDMERVCRKATKKSGIPAVPCYMYALTREGRLPPMASVRKSVYSLLKPAKKRSDAVNLLGFFSSLRDDSELYSLLRSIGIKKICEIARCRDFAEYESMAQANFNLILNPEARYAAADLEKRLSIPSVELTRLYRIDKIRNQYALLGNAIGVTFDDQKYYDEAQKAVSRFRKSFGSRSFAVGEWLNADPFELSLALIQYGFSVAEIYGTIGDANFPYIRKLASVSPDTKIFSNLSPSMVAYRSHGTIDICLGQDAMYYHPDLPGIRWNGEEQPFGYAGVRALFEELVGKMEAKT